MHINKGLKADLTASISCHVPSPPPSPVLYAGLSLEGEWVTRKVTLFCIEGMIPVSKWIRDPMRVVKEFSTQVVVDILHEDLHRAS